MSNIGSFSLRLHIQHLCDISPWPLLLSLILFGVVSSFVLMFRMGSVPSLVLLTLLLGFIWGSDIVSESSYLGMHIETVSNSLLISINMFIFSEVIFFVGFFWSLYYTMYCGESMVGMVFPPLGVEVLDPYGIPLLNTVLLLSSGVTVTWSHHSLGSGEFSHAANGILLSILLGVIFLACQFIEYNNAIFSMSDGVFGSNFFALTSFHGFHVTVSTIGLILCWARIINADVLSGKSISHDCFIWYWHFVDVVWLGLFLIVYINLMYIS